MCPSEFVQLDCTWLLPPHLTAEMTVGKPTGEGPQ